MCSKGNEPRPKGSTWFHATGMMEGAEGIRSSCHSSRLKNYLKESSTDTPTEGSALTSVYKRRKFQKEPITSVLPQMSNESNPLEKVAVFRRRKQYNPDVAFPTEVPEDASTHSELFGAPASSLESESPCLSMEKHTENEASHEPEGLRSCMSVVKCSGELFLSRAEASDGCLNEHHGSVFKGREGNNVELQSAVYRRRKHYNPAVIVPNGVSEPVLPSAELSGNQACSLGSKNPSLVMEKCTDHKASDEPEGVKSCASVVGVNEPVSAPTEASDGHLKQKPGTFVKGIGENNVELQSSVYRRRKYYNPVVAVPTGVSETVQPSSELSGDKEFSLGPRNSFLAIEKHTHCKTSHRPEGLKSCVSTVIFSDKPVLTNAEANDGCLNKHVGPVVKGMRENHGELQSAVYCRRKHYNPMVAVPTGMLESRPPSADSSGGHDCSFGSKYPSSAVGKHTDHKASHEPDDVRSSISVAICTSKSMITHTGAVGGCVNELHGSDVKESRNVDLHSAVYQRRKRYNAAVVFPTGVPSCLPPKAEIHSGQASSLSKENPPIATKEHTGVTSLHETKGGRCSLSPAICSNEPDSALAGSIGGFSAEQHGFDVKGKGKNNVDLCRAVYWRRKRYNAENPPIATKKHASVTGLHETEGGRSSSSPAICKNEPDSAHAGSIDGFSAEQHGFDVKGEGKNDVNLCRAVYRRRTRYNPAVLLNTGALENVSSNGKLSCDHTSSPMLENPSSGTEKHTDHIASNEMEGGRSSNSVVVCSDEPVMVHSEAIDKRLAVHHGSAVDGVGQKLVELYSVDDSCSSSMINMDAGSTSLNMEVYENGECSSSGAFVGELMGDEMSEKDLCISILKSNGLLSCCIPSESRTFEEGIASSSGVGSSCSCNVCGLLGDAVNMLICDQCEKAFHVSCCSPSMRKISFDEWSCPCCFKKKHKIMKQANGPRPSESKAKRCPIALMLKENEGYATNVRIGKDFQADVPCWSGPMKEFLWIRSIDVSREPMMLNPPYDLSSFHVLSSEQLPVFSTLTNWLQCQDVVVGAGDRDGTVCGRWRRAPLFEVQTENWDCFSSVFWDPKHADCAAPQELETDEVLKQLKYVEMLRPRLEAKKRKLAATELDHPQGH